MTATQTATTTRVPNIQRPEILANENVIHYGYCAYNDISLIGATGIEFDIQPGNSPFRTMLPAKELIPFVTMEVGEIDRAKVEALSNTALGGDIITRRNKSARECITEITRAYQGFGFRYLEPLTGIMEEDAFRIFQTIQPFLYRLKDLSNELSITALARIDQTDSYTVEYQGTSITLDPLPDHLKDIAEQARAIMSNSANQAITQAETIIADTVQKMTMYFSTGNGKDVADVRDKYIFGQMERELPQLFNSTPNRTTPKAESSYLRQIAEGFKNLVPQNTQDSDRIAQLEAQVQSLLALNQAKNVSAEIEYCIETSKTTGERCKMKATKDGRCTLHNKV
jgi:hypothetical protein